MTNLFLQITVLLCFIGVVIVLFFEDQDYIYFSFIFIVLAGLLTAIFIPEARYLDFYINSIEWEVVIFLITMFVIVEILKETKIFENICN